LHPNINHVKVSKQYTKHKVQPATPASTTLIIYCDIGRDIITLFLPVKAREPSENTHHQKQNKYYPKQTFLKYYYDEMTYII